MRSRSVEASGLRLRSPKWSAEKSKWSCSRSVLGSAVPRISPLDMQWSSCKQARLRLGFRRSECRPEEHRARPLQFAVAVSYWCCHHIRPWKLSPDTAQTPRHICPRLPAVQVVVYQKFRNSGNRMRRRPKNDVPGHRFSAPALFMNLTAQFGESMKLTV